MSLRGIYRGPRGILCTRGEKAHTSKRVSIIACNNVISKVQCATHHRERTLKNKTFPFREIATVSQAILRNDTSINVLQKYRIIPLKQ